MSYFQIVQTKDNESEWQTVEITELAELTEYKEVESTDIAESLPSTLQNEQTRTMKIKTGKKKNLFIKILNWFLYDFIITVL